MSKANKTMAGICAMALAVSSLMGTMVYAADESSVTNTAVTTTSTEAAVTTNFTIAAKWVGNNLRITWNKIENANRYRISIKDTSVEGSKWENYKSIKGIGCYLTDLEQDHTYSICIMAVRDEGESSKIVTSRIITVLRDRTIEGAIEGITVAPTNPEENKDKNEQTNTNTTVDTKPADTKPSDTETKDENKQEEDKKETEDKKEEVVNNNYKYGSGATYTACDVNYMTKYAKGTDAVVEFMDEHEVFEDPIYIPGNMTLVDVSERNGLSANDKFVVKNYIKLGYEGTTEEFNAVKAALTEKGVSFAALTTTDEAYKEFATAVEGRGSAANIDAAYKGSYKGLTVVLCKDASGYVRIEYSGSGTAKLYPATKGTFQVSRVTDVYGICTDVLMPTTAPCLAMYDMYSPKGTIDRNISGTFAVTAEQAKAYFDALEKNGYMPTSVIDTKEKIFGTSYYNTGKLTIYAQYYGQNDTDGYLVITASHKR